jgi:hypothetical protein
MYIYQLSKIHTSAYSGQDNPECVRLEYLFIISLYIQF